MNTPPPSRTRLSPCGKYRLHIQPQETRPGCWNVLDVDVFEQNTERLIAKTSRNYPVDNIIQFLRQDERDYLLISENYHGGYGCIDLQTGEKVVFSPPPKSGEHWCWAALAEHDPDQRQLIISGCYWAAPYERAAIDFSHPMQVPYPVLNVVDEPFEDDDEEAEEEPSGDSSNP